MLPLSWMFLGLVADARNMGLMPILSLTSPKQVDLGPAIPSLM